MARLDGDRGDLSCDGKYENAVTWVSLLAVCRRSRNRTGSVKDDSDVKPVSVKLIAPVNGGLDIEVINKNNQINEP